MQSQRKLFIDTEFNGLGGELISMGIVAEDGREFYAVRGTEAAYVPWVAEHVAPHLDQWPCEPWEFCERLRDFIIQFDGCEFIADWPADFQHLTDQMSRIGAEMGFELPIECTMTLLRGSPDIKPQIPHNALSDARALRDWYLGSISKHYPPMGNRVA